MSDSPNLHNINGGDISPHKSPYVRSKSKSRSKDRSRSFSRSRSRSHSGDRKKSRRSRRSSTPRHDGRSRKRRSYSRSHSRSRSYSRDRRSRSYSRGRSRSPMSSRRRHMGTREDPNPNRCLGVFGLSLFTTEREIHRIFSKYGALSKVQVVVDAKTPHVAHGSSCQSGRSRGFAFVYFEHIEDASEAKHECSGMEIDGRRIRVDYSITERPHTPTPGIYMGQPTVSYGRRGGGGSRYGRRRSPSPSYKSSKWRSPSPYSRGSRRSYRSRSRSYSPRRSGRY